MISLFDGSSFLLEQWLAMFDPFEHESLFSSIRGSVICKRGNPIWRRTATNSESLRPNGRYFKRGRNARNGKAITPFRVGLVVGFVVGDFQQDVVFG